ncbi:MAG: GMC family oxidoreductase [Burkholderiales bacterium]|nr:MAG: GMC family oxidoreductase [Burkholderiales bacterium]
MRTFDYIVIGGGTAGCVLANRLSANPAHTVLLLEAGQSDNYVWIHIPVGYLFCIDNPRTDWRYRTEAEPGLHGRSLLYPRGKVMGGSSSINGMIYMRGQQADYDQWAAQGCIGWDWASVLPYFLRSEDHHGGPTPLHGAGHELRVEKQRLSWAILDAFQAAAAQAGIPPVDDFNTGDNFGCGYFEVNQRRGVRWNARKAFIEPIKHRRNLHILTSALVDTLDIDHHMVCRGVNTLIAGERHSFMANKEVILCAGAVNSPAILERSGIGRAEVLHAANVPCKLDTRGVGENLQDHLQLRLAFKVQGVTTLNEQVQTWWGKARMGLQYALLRRGPLTMSPSQLGCFARTASSPQRTNVEYHVQPLSLDKFGEPLHNFPAFTASVCDLQPSSRGHIHICDANPQSAPRIVPNYLSTTRDQHIAAEAIELTRRIVAQPALAHLQPQEFLPGPQAQSTEQLIEAAGRIGTTIFHPVSTCRMGPDSEAEAVLDPQLRVRGVHQLRVADASAMPTITSGNTNAPTVMIAEKAADFIIKG